MCVAMHAESSLRAGQVEQCHLRVKKHADLERRRSSGSAIELNRLHRLMVARPFVLLLKQ